MTPFDWTSYLTLAEELVQRQGDEAAERSAISRAYYAALGRAAGVLRAEGREVSPMRTHAMVWRAFAHSPNDRRQAIGLELNRLRQARDRADYAGSFDDLSDAAVLSVERAKNLLGLLDELTSPSS